MMEYYEAFQSVSYESLMMPQIIVCSVSLLRKIGGKEHQEVRSLLLDEVLQIRKLSKRKGSSQKHLVFSSSSLQSHK
jgi:hypothetical protein